MKRLLGLAASLIVVFAAAVFPPEPASAEQFRPPRIGQSFVAAGFSLQPGFLYDGVDPANTGLSPVAPAGATMGKIGFHQILAKQFIMSAEADIGAQWVDEHTAQIDGQADSEWAVSWQLGLYGRWLPFGDRAGWSFGAGPEFYHAYLQGQGLQSLGLGLRVGRYIWTREEHFVLVEFGYSAPFIQGLKRGENFGQSDDSVNKNWTFHRFGLSIQYGF
jgi:hypothetical protein